MAVKTTILPHPANRVLFSDQAYGNAREDEPMLVPRFPTKSKIYLGTTMETVCCAVPPRRFEPIIEIVCCPGSKGSVKCRNCPSGAIFGTDCPFTISAAPGSVRPTISPTRPG